MAINWTFAVGRPDYDWEILLQEVLENGTFAVNEGPGSTLTLTSGSGTTLVLLGTDLETDGSGNLVTTSGSINSFELVATGSISVFTLDNITIEPSTEDFQDVLDGAGGLDPQGDDFKDLLATLFNEVVNGTGSSDADSIFGTPGSDILNGNDGNDFFLTGGGGVDDIDGGNGFDFLGIRPTEFTSGVTIDFLNGQLIDKDGDVLVANLTSIENANGTVGNDTFISAGPGSDHYWIGGDGADDFQGDPDGRTMIGYFNEGGDSGFGVIVNLSGDTLDDIDIGNGPQDVAAGTAIDTYGSVDTLSNISGIDGTDFDDFIVAGGLDTALIGHGGNDVLRGGDGSDFFEGGDGADFIDGGNNWDKVSYENEDGTANGVGIGITVDVLLGTILDTYGNTDFVSGIEGFKGSDFIDTFNGFVWDDYFEGLGGNDIFNGGGGRDQVDYQHDVDRNGNDGVIVNLSSVALPPIDVTGATGVVVAANRAKDGFGDTDTLNSIEDATGTNVNDWLEGSNARNNLEGRGGDDTIRGNGGNDNIRGDDGNDTLFGGDGRDDLDGGRGDDIINAGSGEFDHINGSAGTDTVQGDDGFDQLAFDGYDGSDGDHAGDAVTVTLNDTADGSGTVTGFFGEDDDDDTDGGTDEAVSTTFQNVERVRGTRNGDNFISTDVNFVNTDEASRSWGGLRGVDGVFEFTGGDGADTFNITNNLAIINYDEERWTHNDYNGDHDWGQGPNEFGVAINLSGDGTPKDIDVGNGPDTIATGFALDTYGQLDILTAANAFRLTDANDFIFAGNFDTYAEGRRGDDYFEGLDGNDQFNGGEGVDTMFGGNGHDQLNGDDGDDELHGGAGSDSLDGGNGVDTIDGDGGRDDINGGDGNDILNGGLGNDNIRGDSGNDTIHGDSGYDELEGNDGQDTIFGDTGDDRIRGGNDNDTLQGDLGDDEIEGDDGVDTIHGDDDDDNDVAGGNDRLRGGNGNDFIFGGYGDDEIEGQADNDTLHGGFGDDMLRGNDGIDTLNGNEGNDELDGGNQADTLNGGDGDDRLFGGFDDAAIDTLNGGNGNDYLEGGDGNDVLDGGAGTNVLNGGSGNDTYVLGASTTNIIFEDSGVDLITTTIGRNLNDFGAIENATLLAASAGGLTGNTLNNVLTGSTVANTLSGGDGLDTLVGGNGNDILNGDGGNDTLIGGNQNDTLTGGAGRDTMTGGANNDTFDFNVFSETGTTVATRDIITDFVKGQDKIDVNGIDANTGVGGNQNFALLAKGTATSAVGVAKLGWYQENPAGTVNDKTIIRGNIDADAVIEFTIQINGLINLAAADFTL